MKTMTKVLVLATITLISATSFAADVGQQKDSKCPEVATNSGQKATQEAAAPAAAPAGTTTTNGAAH